MNNFLFFRRAQASLEFIILFVFALILVSLALYSMGFFSLEFSKQEATLYREDVANLIIEEFNIYGEVLGGYERNISIPSFLLQRYDIEFNQSRSLLIMRDYIVENGEVEYYYDLPTAINFNTHIDLDGNLVISMEKEYNQDKTYALVTEEYTYVEPLNCTNIPYGEWVMVRGNNDLGTRDFCVMKYEAKVTPTSIPNLGNPSSFQCGGSCPTDGSINITSIADYRPLTSITQSKAASLCSNLGSRYKLISNAYHVTITREIENNPLNWFGGVVGSNFIYVGHTESGGKLNASIDDNDGYYLTGDSETMCDGNYNNYDISENTLTGKACVGQRRTHYLEDGGIIWDISGNVQELTSTNLYRNTETSLGVDTNNWVEWDQIVGNDFMRSLDYSLNSSNGIGRIHTSGNTVNPAGDLHMVRRGGQYSDGFNAGIYSGTLNREPWQRFSGTGFRCIYN